MVIRYASRVVTAANRALLFQSRGGGDGDDGSLRFRLGVRLGLAGQVLFFGIFCNGEPVRLMCDPCDELISHQ